MNIYMYTHLHIVHVQCLIICNNLYTCFITHLDCVINMSLAVAMRSYIVVTVHGDAAVAGAARCGAVHVAEQRANQTPLSRQTRVIAGVQAVHVIGDHVFRLVEAVDVEEATDDRKLTRHPAPAAARH